MLIRSHVTAEPTVVQNRSITPKGSLMTTCHQSFLWTSTPGNHWSISVTMTLPPLQHHISETAGGIFRVYLLSLSIMHLRVVFGLNSLVLLTTVWLVIFPGTRVPLSFNHRNRCCTVGSLPLSGYHLHINFGTNKFHFSWKHIGE